ncbi:MAG TPA: hypothetical protein VKU19_36590 [Bryobacteraceae bacterium]|nr:hypothetical protein [Bryobacteraceae bacterium]
MTLPDSLTINAFNGRAVPSGELEKDGGKWALRNAPGSVKRFLKEVPRPDPWKWQHPEIGWGLVVAEPPGAKSADMKANADLPQCLLDLVAERGNAPVLRFRESSDKRYTLLRNWQDGKDLDMNASAAGTKTGQIPAFLMIWGTPEEIPWRVQYQLEAGGKRFVGRVPLKDKKLENYVNALRSGWSGSKSDPHAPLVWATDHSSSDISALMRASIAEPLYAAFTRNSDLQPYLLAGAGQASQANLILALSQKRPGMVVTTSHGFTGPLDDAAQLKQNLGLLVDQQNSMIALDALFKEWQPDGAIWYAHACCSAGCDESSSFDGLLKAGSEIDNTLKAVAGLGSRVASLAEQLLGAEKPARAFLGHVEPAFNWTLQQPATGQFLTSTLETARREIYLGHPCGYAFGDWHARYGTHTAAYESYKSDYDGSETIQARMLYQRLVAQDVRTLVLLGDPTVALPIE